MPEKSIGTVRDLLAAGETKEALEALALLLQEEDAELHFLSGQLQVQYALLEERSGVMPESQLIAERGKVSGRVRTLLQQLSPSGPEETPVTPSSEPGLGELVWVNGGSFTRKVDEKANATVRLPPFYIQPCPVTNGQFADFLHIYGSDKVKGGPYAGEPLIFPHKWGMEKEKNAWRAAAGYERHPVVWVTWFGAHTYAEFQGWRLPTEAEWEYAARGGPHSAGFVFSGSDELDQVGWYEQNSDGITHPVGEKQANELGLCDMSGNVFEWCGDWYAEDYFLTLLADGAPRIPQTGQFRVIRGGAWNSFADDCRGEARKSFPPRFRFNNLGFRCAASPD